MDTCIVFGVDIHSLPLSELMEVRRKIDGEIVRRGDDKERISFQQKRELVCPNVSCGSGDIIKYGRHRDKQIYRCKTCGRQFQATSGTCVSDAKLSVNDIDSMVLCFILDLPVWVISYVTGKSEKTVQYWRYQVARIAGSYLDGITLSTKVWIDETYWRITEKGVEYVNSEERRKRGLSSDLVCVVIAYDIHGHYLCRVLAKPGKPNSAGIMEALKDNIEPESLLIHDGEKAHRRLVEHLRLKEEVVTTGETDKDRRRMIQTIDNACALLKFEVYKHKGIRTNHLQEHLDLFFYKVASIKKNGVSLTVEYTKNRLYKMNKEVKYHELWPRKKEHEKAKVSP